MKDTCERYRLLAPGDRIMVAMSGGKDSYTLFHLLTGRATSLGELARMWTHAQYNFLKPVAHQLSFF